MADPSGRQPRAGGLRLLLLAVLVAAGMVVAAGLAPASVRSLVPGVGALVARAWSAAAPQPAGAGAVAGRLSAAEVQALSGEADEAWQRGDWAVVAERLTTLAAAGPHTREQEDRLYEAELNLGWGSLGVGKHSEAEAHLARALEIRPDAPEALEGLRIARQPAPARPAVLPEAPVAQVVVSQAPAPVQAASGESVAVIVQPGDTLFALARRFGTTVEAIKVANGLPCSTILAGQKLVIPVCVPACPAPQPVPVVCAPVCPTPACVPVCPPVVCVPVCPPVVCVPVCPTPVCVPICPAPVCVPTIDP